MGTQNKECVLHAYLLEVACARCESQEHWRGRTLQAILKTAQVSGWKIIGNIAYCPKHSSIPVTLRLDGRRGKPTPAYDLTKRYDRPLPQFDLAKPNPRYDQPVTANEEPLPVRSLLFERKKQLGWKERRANRLANHLLPCIECDQPRAPYQGFGQPPKRCETHVKRRKKEA